MKKINFLALVITVLLFSCGKKSNNSGTLFQDDFSKESNLKNWEIVDCQSPASGPSEWKIENGELFQTSNIYREDREYEMYEGTKAITKDDKDWTNYEFSTDFRITGDDDGVGVVFRYQDPEHYYRFITLQDPSNNGPFCKLQVKDGDNYTTLDEVQTGYDAATTHNIKIVANGDELTVYLDGKKILSAKDSKYKNGRIGLMCYAEQPAFDNVIVKAISE